MLTRHQLAAKEKMWWPKKKSGGQRIPNMVANFLFTNSLAAIGDNKVVAKNVSKMSFKLARWNW